MVGGIYVFFYLLNRIIIRTFLSHYVKEVKEAYITKVLSYFTVFSLKGLISFEFINENLKKQCKLWRHCSINTLTSHKQSWPLK